MILFALIPLVSIIFREYGKFPSLQGYFVFSLLTWLPSNEELFFGFSLAFHTIDALPTSKGSRDFIP